MAKFNFKTTEDKKQEEGEQPKIPREERYTGMKKKPKFGAKKKKPLSYQQICHSQTRPKRGLSPHQIKNFNNTIKVREGESEAEWRKRTRNIRVIEEQDVVMLAATKKHKIMFVNRKKHTEKRINTYLVSQNLEREFNFLKYYAAVMNFMCVKHNVRKDDLEMGFYFYENNPFTKEMFENVCVLHTGAITGKWKRFMDRGFLVEFQKLDKRPKMEPRYLDTGMYKLSKSMIKLLAYIYGVVGQVNGIRMKQATIHQLSPEIKEIFLEMNREITEIKSGKKPPEEL